MFPKSVAISLFVLLLSFVTAAQPQNAAERKLVRAFQKRVQAYINFRDAVARAAPPVSANATPEQIHARKIKLQQEVRRRRANVREGNLFVPGIAPYFLRLIKHEFPGEEAAELRRQVLETDTNAVPIKVNAVYPETVELVAMPPPLLLTLPQLHKDLRYRFVGRALVVMDRDAALILDVLRDALP